MPLPSSRAFGFGSDRRWLSKHRDPDKEEEKAKPYKLDTCIVSGDKLGEIGKPVIFEH